MREMRLVYVEGDGKTGYYVGDDTKFYRIDFSKEPTSPEPVDRPPAVLDIDRLKVKPLSIPDEILREKEKEIDSKIKEIVKEHKDRIKNISDIDELENKIKEVLYAFIDEMAMKVVPPHEIRITGDIYGNVGISCFLYFDGGVPNTWDELQDYDRIKVKKATGYYVGDGEVAFHTDFNNLLLPEFYITDKETTKKIEDIVRKYATVDYNDTLGHIFGSVYMPQVKWDYIDPKIDSMKRRFIQERIEGEERKEREEIERLWNKYGEQIEFVSRNIHYLDGMDLSYGDRAKYLMENRNRIISYNPLELEYIASLKEDIEKKIEFYKNPDSVVFQKDGFEITVGDILNNKGVVRLPKELIGHFIGRGGSNIKRLSQILNIRIKAVELDNKAENNIKKRPRL